MPTTKKETFGSIWKTLRAVDISGSVSKNPFNECSYISWAHAWALLMEIYPDAIWEDGPIDIHSDGTVTVTCSVTIAGHTRSMFLPVMSGRANQAVSNPGARDIGDAKMRCLVKCLGLFGLGLSLWLGEAIGPTESVPKAKVQTVNQGQLKDLLELLTHVPDADYEAFLEWAGVESLKNLPASDFERVKNGLETKIRVITAKETA